MAVGGRTSEFGVIRSELGQFIVGAVVVALGAGVVASGLVQIFSDKAAIVTIFGFIVLFSGLFVAAWRVLPVTSGNLSVNLLFLLDSKSRKPIDIPRYGFSGEVSSYIKALSAENKAIAKAWSENKFHNMPKMGEGIGVTEEKVVISENESAKLAVEAIEYFVLDTLSTHFTDYFNQEATADPLKLVTFERNDVPGIFTQNRFLDLFSRPMNEREAFAERSGGSRGGKVVFAYGPGGVRYDHFDLTLPKGAKISRDRHGAFGIATSKFSLTIRCSVSFASYGVSWDFLKYYLGIGYSDIDDQIATIDVKVKFSPLQLFSKSGIQYYRWVDEFLEKLVHEADFECFLNDIGWETALTCQMLGRHSDRGPNQDGRQASTRKLPPRKGI